MKFRAKNPLTGKNISLTPTNLASLALGGVVLYGVAYAGKKGFGYAEPYLNPNRYTKTTRAPQPTPSQSTRIV